MDRPNILLLFPDQWRGDHLGCAGHPSLRTPQLDELAAAGVRFTRAYTPSPSCIAARAALMTGLAPHRTGRLGYRDGVPWRYPTTFASLLRDAGWQTICAGKTHFFPMRARLGFEELALYDANLSLGEGCDDYRAWLRTETGGRVRDTVEEMSSNAWMPRPWVHEERLHPNVWTTDRAIDALDRRDPQRPFLLAVQWHRPHPPYDPPLRLWQDWARREPAPPLLGDWCAGEDVPLRQTDGSYGRLPPAVLADARRAYAAQIEHLDEQIGRLRRWLEVHGEWQRTWVVFASDHGELLGDHHRFRKRAPFAGSARIPFIVRPAGARAGDREPTTCAAPVSLCDLLPTFAAIAGITPPAEVDGASLLPLLADPAAPWRAWQHGEHANGEGWQYLTSADRTYIWESMSGREWLFDSAADPGELRDLSGSAAHREELESWRRRLADILARRPEDGLVADGRLQPGRVPPVVRPHLLETGA